MHDHPEVRDDEMRRAAAQLRAAHACAAMRTGTAALRAQVSGR